LRVEPSNSTAWMRLGMVGGGVVDGVHHTAKRCYERSLDPAPSPDCVTQSGLSCRWALLGREGGGEIMSISFSETACYEHALECVTVETDDVPALTKLWCELAGVGGGTVSGVARTAAACLDKALELDPECATARAMLDAMLEEWARRDDLRRAMRSLALLGGLDDDGLLRAHPAKRPRCEDID